MTETFSAIEPDNRGYAVDPMCLEFRIWIIGIWCLVFGIYKTG